MKNTSVQFLVKSGLIAAVYAITTLILSPLSFGAVQVRISEALCILPLYTPAAIPGLTLGCFISGILGPNGIIDAAIGSIATLIGSVCIYAFKKKPWMGLLLNVISNAVLVGFVLAKIYTDAMPISICMLFVGLGEFVSCFVFGTLLKKYMDTRGTDFLNRK